MLKGLSLADGWRLQKLILLTDSKTVYGWLTVLVGNTKRIKVSGLHEVIVQRQLQVISDVLEATGMEVEVE